MTRGLTFAQLTLALLFHAARVISSPCFHATVEPGAKVLQVFHHVREERLDLLRVYSPLVAGQFALTHEDVVWPGFHTIRCLNNSNMYYVQCLASMLRSLESSSGLQGDGEAPCSASVHVAGESAAPWACPEFTNCAGVMFHHSDFWVHPWILQHRATDHAWILSQGLVGRGEKVIPAFCASGDALIQESEWTWPMTDRKQVVALLDAFYNVTQPPPSVWPRGRICFGHSDFYYLPSAAFLYFSRAASYFYGVFHEVGIPTLLHLSIAESGVVNAPLTCSGSCWGKIQGDLNNHACGHRIDLSDTATAENMRAVWALAMVSGAQKPNASFYE
jgi:hypothetical protein